MKVVENKRLRGKIITACCFVLNREHADVEKNGAVFLLMLLVGKKKKKRYIYIYMVIVNLPKIIHSERQTTSFLSPLLLSLTSIHSGVFLRWLSLSHALVMEDFAVSL